MKLSDKLIFEKLVGNICYKLKTNKAVINMALREYEPGTNRKNFK